MSGQHPTLTTHTSPPHRMRPTAADFAAAAAPHDPSLLLQLQAAQSHGDPPITSPCPAR
jgi:hypothetical protein